jgi:hypothetical protein
MSVGSARPEWWLAGAVLALYLASFTLPAIQVPEIQSQGGPLVLSGFFCFRVGLSSALRGDFLGVAWSANLLLLLGFVLLLARRLSLALAAGAWAVAAGLCVYQLDLPGEWHLREGFYLWIGSMGLLVVGSGLTPGPRGARAADRELGDLAVLGPLEDLDLSGSEVTDDGLQCLTRLPELRKLNLADTAVTDAGLRPLAGLPRLEELDLSGTAVGDAGLDHLTALVGLRRLHLGSTRVSAAAVERLRAALPGLRVCGPMPDRWPRYVREQDL